MPRRTVVILVAVLAGSQLAFWLLSPGTDNSGEAAAFFREQDLDGPLAIALSALAFALPHLGDSLTGRQAIA